MSESTAVSRDAAKRIGLLGFDGVVAIDLTRMLDALHDQPHPQDRRTEP